MRYCLIVAAILIASPARASVNVVVNGATHTIPQTNEKGWGANVTAWIQAISQFTLQNSGGNFTLTAEANTGATYGFKVPYIKTATANPSAAGVLRLGVSDSIGWRNNANDANLLLAVDGSDRLTFNGVLVTTAGAASFDDSLFKVYDNSDNTKFLAFELSGITTGTTRTLTVPNASTTIVGTDVAQTLTNKTLTAPVISSIVNTGTLTLPTSTDTLIGKATTDTLTNKTFDADGDGNSITNIENADIKAAAGIALNKLGATTVSRALVSDGSGFITAATTTATEIGYVNGVTSSIQTQLGTKVTNPMTTGGDLIYGGASGTPTRLANGASGQYLKSAGGTSAPTWQTFTAPTIQKFLSGSGTYTTPTGVLYIKVTMVGGGGGGAQGGASAQAGTTGGDTTFNNLTASGGVGAVQGNSAGATGGAASVGAGWTQLAAIAGGKGSGASIAGAAQSVPGGSGGASYFGGNGGGGQTAAAGSAGQTNSGGGGGGGSSPATTSTISGAGGGAGGFVQGMIISPAASYSYAVGGGGAGGTSGGGNAGGAGGSGVIIVEEFYN